MRLLLRGVRVIDPVSGIDAADQNVLVDGGVLARFGSNLSVVDAEVVELRRSTPSDSCVVTPAFIDLHTHLREPGNLDAESVHSGAAAAAAGGFSHVVAMANTVPPIDTPTAVREAVTRNHSAAVRVLQAAAVSRGLAGEELVDVEACADSGAVAFSDDGRNACGEAMLVEALRRASAVGRPVLVHPEDERMIAALAPDAHSVVRCAERPADAEVSAVRTALAALRQVPEARLHLQHISTAGALELLAGARSEGLGVTAEVTPHHLTMADGARTPAHRVNPPLRMQEDVRALRDALRDGLIDAIATDHAPHPADAKGGRYADAAPGMIGLETALPQCLRLVTEHGIPLTTVIDRLTLGPSRVLGETGGRAMRGLLIGAPATLTLFDPVAAWTVTADSLRSRSRNTPLLGNSVRGRVLLTMVKGNVVHRDASLDARTAEPVHG